MVPDKVAMVAEVGNGKFPVVRLVTFRFVMVALVTVSWPIAPLAPRICDAPVVPKVVPVTVVMLAEPPEKLVAKRLVTVPLAMLALVMLALPYPSVVPDSVVMVAEVGNIRLPE